MAIDVKDLVRKEREYHESVKPVDVEVILGDRLLTVRVPYIWGDQWDDLASKYPVPRGLRGNRGRWDLDAVMREHPGVVLIDGDDEDDMFVLRDRTAVYRWPEVYDALRLEDRESLQAVIWGLHVLEPGKRLKAAMEARAQAENAARAKAEREAAENG